MGVLSRVGPVLLTLPDVVYIVTLLPSVVSEMAMLAPSGEYAA